MMYGLILIALMSTSCTIDASVALRDNMSQNKYEKNILWESCLFSCRSDIIRDGVINEDDLSALLMQWGNTSGYPADITGDNIVDISDLLVLLENWGPVQWCYTVTEIELPINYSVDSAYVRGINEDGIVVGWINEYAPGQPYSMTRPFKWKEGVLTYLELLSEDIDGVAIDINNDGIITGWSGINLANNAVKWENNQAVDLGKLGSIGVHYANGINNEGYIVGESSGHGFVWNPYTGEMEDLGALFQTSRACAINDEEVIVGTSRVNAFSSHAVRWVNGIIQDLGTINGLGSWSDAHAINNEGIIAGYANYNLNIGLYHAFLWDPVVGEMQDLGTIDTTWCANSYALGINQHDFIIGRSEVASYPDHAFLWWQGIMTDLNQLIPPHFDWVLIEADNINNQGQIIGSGESNNQDRLFLLNPLFSFSNRDT